MDVVKEFDDAHVIIFVELYMWAKKYCYCKLAGRYTEITS